MCDEGDRQAKATTLVLSVGIVVGLCVLIGVPVLISASRKEGQPKVASSLARPTVRAIEADRPRKQSLTKAVEPVPEVEPVQPRGHPQVTRRPPESEPDEMSRPERKLKNSERPDDPATSTLLDPKPVPVPGQPLRELVPGYETRRVNGFTILLSTHAVREAKQEDGKPFLALTTELDGIAKVLPPKALTALQRVMLWIEWDNIDRANPRTLAKYYGGTIWKLDGSAHPLKSNAVELLSLKKLAEEKDRSIEKTRLVLLHELAHAVHHVLLGFNNPNVIFAYNQAMDRRLYDRVQNDRGGVGKAYAATNAAEYFAELTCAYLDRCQSYPFNRDELRDHDPTGYRLMENVWKAPVPKEGKAKAKP